MSALTVRPARADDVDRLIAIHLAAFPDDRGIEARRRNFENNPFGPFSALRVVERAGVLVGHAFLFSFGAWFGGRVVPIAGIASVGVAPEARGRGVAAALLAALEDEARARGDALVLLYPFRAAFYRRHGFSPVTPLRRIDASPRSVPHAWVDAARRSELRVATGEDAAAVESCYRTNAMQTTGLLERPAALWDRKRLNERRHYLVLPGDGGALRGYVAFRHVQRETHADTFVDVDELVAIDDDARRVLWGALGTQRDQARALRFNAPDGDPIALALEDADRDRGGTEDVEHPLGVLVGGPMLKVLDIERALAARGYAHDGAARLRVGARAFELRVVGGAATVRALDAAPEGPAFTEGGLASVAFGAVRARDAARIGWVEGPDVAGCDALFALPPFEVVDPF